MGDAAISFQVNNLHDGNDATSALRPPLRQIWAVNLEGAVSYPLIVGNRVFVGAGAAGGQTPNRLLALDAETGSTVWGPVDLGTGGWDLFALAYNRGTGYTSQLSVVRCKRTTLIAARFVGASSSITSIILYPLPPATAFCMWVKLCPRDPARFE